MFVYSLKYIFGQTNKLNSYNKLQKATRKMDKSMGIVCTQFSNSLKMKSKTFNPKKYPAKE